MRAMRGVVVVTAACVRAHACFCCRGYVRPVPIGSRSSLCVSSNPIPARIWPSSSECSDQDGRCARHILAHALQRPIKTKARGTFKRHGHSLLAFELAFIKGSGGAGKDLVSLGATLVPLPRSRRCCHWLAIPSPAPVLLARRYTSRLAHLGSEQVFHTTVASDVSNPVLPPRQFEVMQIDPATLARIRIASTHWSSGASTSGDPTAYSPGVESSVVPWGGFNPCQCWHCPVGHPRRRLL